MNEPSKLDDCGGKCCGDFGKSAPAAQAPVAAKPVKTVALAAPKQAGCNCG